MKVLALCIRRTLRVALCHVTYVHSDKYNIEKILKQWKPRKPESVVESCGKVDLCDTTFSILNRTGCRVGVFL